MKSPYTFEQKKSFILAHPELIIKKASIYHPFSQEDLRKYRSILDWEGVVDNTNILWLEAIIDEFKQEVFFDKKYYRNKLHTNEALPWSIPFIERYQDLWRWEELAENEVVTQDKKMRRYFSSKLRPHINLKDERWRKEYNAKSFGQQIAEMMEDCDFLSFANKKEHHIIDPAEIETFVDIDWDRLSSNDLLPWSAALIEKYESKWNWEYLIWNDAVKWDFDLLKKYEDRIPWIVDFENSPGEFVRTASLGVSGREYIEWDVEMLRYFEEKLDFEFISKNKATSWSLDLLLAFEPKWSYEELSMNPKLWKSAFPEFDNECQTVELLDAILGDR
ncbi:hypothetical protein EGI26_14890 [Lacihabitans sp. CCS-44]|uniref:hypothetical protein n=1 Tax=Lacihabitans sp. CCS-44 TaxID=2487331 RepID=UPI0020CC6EC4|nr:hypothetical protein [Lacihabitans sp. CCS-44]MCP9756449.1 hypothetical protein [Lacihabitans sp. CCS-44]